MYLSAPLRWISKLMSVESRYSVEDEKVIFLQFL